jgi:hypothetical protein
MKKIPLSRLAVLIFVAFFAALAAANYLIPAALFLRSNSFQPFVLAAVTLATLSVTLAYGFAQDRAWVATIMCLNALLAAERLFYAGPSWGFHLASLLVSFAALGVSLWRKDSWTKSPLSPWPIAMFFAAQILPSVLAGNSSL